MSAFGNHMLWPPTPMTLPEAVWLDDGGAVVRLIQNGAAPNAKGTLRAGLVGDTSVEATPLEVAVLSMRPEMVDLLVREGATVDESSAVTLICLARTVEAESIAEYFKARMPNVTDVNCEDVRPPW